MKERYIKMRNSHQVDINWFYEYYIENSKHSISVEDFYNIFMYSNINSILEHIDNKFGLTRLLDKEGNFIKIVE